ncbi:MAG: DUF1028 domain-containing protein [Phycisphaerae bacterium]|nr:DUF1028 domain-containing protein [Phycisphaerae bacterium]
MIVTSLTLPASQATWSIAIADAETGEVAVGTVTCLNEFDLLATVPVVVVGKGAGAAQAAGDFDGIRRRVMFNGLRNGTSPQLILNALAGIEGHIWRQYGIVDTQGRMITYTGSAASAWAGGVTGNSGTMVYAVQGNILTGDCVVPAIEQALLDTPGDIPAKLMAGMQAARQMGGDGRCSCSAGDATSCGCPPAEFDKVGHIGGMVVARIGDTDDTVCDAAGCVDGDYFMRLNVPFQLDEDPDPVVQLQALFDAWRADLAGVTDAIQSTAVPIMSAIPSEVGSTGTLRVMLRDWQGSAVDVSPQLPSITHAPGSQGIGTVGDMSHIDTGVYEIEIHAGGSTGTDRFRITTYDGARPVVLMPDATLHYQLLGDVNCDGSRDVLDIAPFVMALTNPEGYAATFPSCGAALADTNRDGRVDVFDIDSFVEIILP